ncbi:FAD-binding oxidoreductase [Aspergillus brunneoviolaceus CBS 621.78]|uniref:FAD-binding domain-containing protein n=1 Tax=Aspergillus brunneoviolaceus CBS 621.78 TaxID=1450534 RepID=A0ACD1FZA1_9EURO|nr:FAD-binding domain-containing protein [Aspergillus brunneoviolaceus CBS 621.78]RAH42315.1 FAD-binding domain-containing protein [Aspergillus brunneoviolaceus CBS 621.78]
MSTTNLLSILSRGNWSTGTVLSAPGSTDFTDATARWDVYRPPNYAAALSIHSEQDLITAVKLSTANNISFLATGGRHGYSITFGNLQNGLALDLSPLDTVAVDAAAGTLTIGPGVTFGDVMDPVYEAGYQIQTGTCTCVGMIGATIGGGIGRLQGTYGLVIDGLLSARVVTAAGEVLEVSENSNADLFWGIRGAGANLGILTTATYQLHPLTGNYTSIDLIFPASRNVTYFTALENFNISAHWAIETEILYNADINGPEIIASYVYEGDQKEALELLAPILDVGPSFINVTEVPWNELSAIAAFATDAEVCENGSIYDIYGVNLRTLTAATWIEVFEMMVNFWAAYTEGQSSSVVFESWANEAVVAVADEKTAYPWRDTTTYVMLQFVWSTSDSSVEAPSIAMAQKVRDTLIETSGYDDLAVYVNYANGDEALEEMYGARKLPRLAELKKKYDPSNVFRYSNPLPTAYS